MAEERSQLQKSLCREYVFHLGASKREALQFMDTPIHKWDNQTPNQIIERDDENGMNTVFGIIKETYWRKSE